MKKRYMKQKTLLLMTFCSALLVGTSSFAETTTTTTTNPDGSTTVEETTATDANGVPLVGPAGVTGAIRRSDRRQDYRMEQDLEDLGDAAKDRPRSRR
jgi:hypothetical protein